MGRRPERALPAARNRTSSAGSRLPILAASASRLGSLERTLALSLVKFHRLVTTALTLGLAALAGWRAEAFLAGRGWTDLLVAVLAAAAAAGLLLYLARLNRVLHREPGPGLPQDVGR